MYYQKGTFVAFDDQGRGHSILVAAKVEDDKTRMIMTSDYTNAKLVEEGVLEITVDNRQVRVNTDPNNTESFNGCKMKEVETGFTFFIP